MALAILWVCGEDEILLEAKILAVADVTEAKSSFRPYRPALGIDAALDEIRQHRGTLYDRDVVDICLELFTSDKFTFDYHSYTDPILCVASPKTVQSSISLWPKR